MGESSTWQKTKTKKWNLRELCKLNSVKLPDLSQPSPRPPNEDRLRFAPVCSLRKKFVPSSVKQLQIKVRNADEFLSVKHTKLRIQRKQNKIYFTFFDSSHSVTLDPSLFSCFCKSALQISTQLTRCKPSLILSR